MIKIQNCGIIIIDTLILEQSFSPLAPTPPPPSPCLAMPLLHIATHFSGVGPKFLVI